jgi:K+-transporting ATPase ATPase B chain
MDRALRANNYQIRKAVETAGDIDVLLLDKLEHHHWKRKESFYPAKESRRRFYQICSFEFAYDTPEGKSIVELAGIEVANNHLLKVLL